MKNKPDHVGFSQELFIMPFDHRGSFQEKLFGIKGRTPTPEEHDEIAQAKSIVYQGFKLAIKNGVPKEKAGILVDEQFGSKILLEAKKDGFMTSCPAEKSGQDEFDFEYGSEYQAHIRKFSPTFVKVLVRYNPESDAAANQRQAKRLKDLSDFCHQDSSKSKLMFELLVPATEKQKSEAQQKGIQFDHQMRPQLMVQAMKELQKAGIEPDLWKLEGVETEQDFKNIAKQARIEGRSQVGVILLGRGENDQKVEHWVKTASKVPGFIGFAIGRTIFWNPLKAYLSKDVSKEKASELICEKFQKFCHIWNQKK